MIPDKTRVLIKTDNITVVQGEFIIIKGLNGVEKKDFFNIMGCIVRPTDGKVYFDYEDIGLAKSETLDSIRKYKIGYLFKNYNLITSMTVEENLTIPLRVVSISRDEKVSRFGQVLKQFDIADIKGERICKITNFEKQMVALARAVINNPLMIIADEPTDNLNTKEEEKFIEHLLELNREGITIMLISEKKEFDLLSNARHIYIYPTEGALI